MPKILSKLNLNQVDDIEPGNLRNLYVFDFCSCSSFIHFSSSADLTPKLKSKI